MDVASCCKAGVPGVYTGGTSGEFYAMEIDEFKAVTQATVEECRSYRKPAMIGCTSTYTLGAAKRAAYAAEVGADAIQVALPYWMDIGEAQLVPFFKEVTAACGNLPLSIYETTRAKRVLTLDQHRRIKDAVPCYLMVKANEQTLGCTAEGCRALSEFVNVFVSEHEFGSLGRAGAKGSCSSVVYWNPRVVLAMWQHAERQDWASVDAGCDKISKLFDYLNVAFGNRDFSDTAFDRLGGVASGFLKTGLRSRGPYPAATQADAELLRNWYRANFPEMIVT